MESKSRDKSLASEDISLASEDENANVVSPFLDAKNKRNISFFPKFSQEFADNNELLPIQQTNLTSGHFYYNKIKSKPTHYHYLGRLESQNAYGEADHLTFVYPETGEHFPFDVEISAENPFSFIRKDTGFTLFEGPNPLLEKNGERVVKGPFPDTIKKYRNDKILSIAGGRRRTPGKSYRRKTYKNARKSRRKH